MSKPENEQINLTWDTATKMAEEESIYTFEQGTTRIKLNLDAMVEKNTNFKGRFVLTCLINNEKRKISVGAKTLTKISKDVAAGYIEFEVSRIGEGLDTRYLYKPIKTKLDNKK